MSAEQLNAEFEQWWEKEGQFCRAGGGPYEKTFAFRGFENAWNRRAPAQQGVDAWGVVLDGRIVFASISESEAKDTAGCTAGHTTIRPLVYGDAVDAGRYRFLSSNDANCDNARTYEQGQRIAEMWDLFASPHIATKSELDAAIDAAMAQGRVMRIIETGTAEITADKVTFDSFHIDSEGASMSEVDLALYMLSWIEQRCAFERSRLLISDSVIFDQASEP